uniref:NADH:ubiquinone reductase (H(+)-translocating) n=1 Tax=Brachionus rotundiformis TaxID=96890 RepID=A0A1C9J9V2_9BILA|nr:NADH dehydrogenase subunit 5 [Brachionus rotundiformis]
MLIFSLYLTYMYQTIYVSFNLFSLWNSDISCSFYFDYMSCWFTVVVLLISSVVMVYSYNYMSPYSKSVYFLWLTNLFILSMLLVVNMSDLFYLMLGWDGLGLVSFFLIVYYQNQSSITSGLFTLLMNRIGDSFFLVTIMMFFSYSSDLTSFTSYSLDTFLLAFMMITFMTKSAIYPFSPWLPLAMAAPTPISALVHSSTLVTAGLYLMMRYSYFLYSSYHLMKILLVLSIFTSFYAGMNSIFEKDMKKLIALSTLSHLGFIGMAFSAGLLQLAFFHLLTHALFKSLLFMTMGDIMINLNHSQDIRYLSSGMLYTPMSCMVMYVSLLNLLGIPNLSGYFSKDLVLEMMNYSNSSFIVMFMVFLNVFFTYYYTYQLFFYSFQPIKIVPYQNFHSPLLIHTIMLLAMSLLTLAFGFFFMDYICCFIIFFPIPSLLKWFPLMINVFMFIVLFLNGRMFTSSSPLINYYFSNMMYLSNVMMSMSSNFFYNVSFLLVKSGEMGLYNYSLNSLTNFSVQSMSTLLLKISFSNPMKILLFSSFSLLSMWLAI